MVLEEHASSCLLCDLCRVYKVKAYFFFKTIQRSCKSAMSICNLIIEDDSFGLHLLFYRKKHVYNEVMSV